MADEQITATTQEATPAPVETQSVDTAQTAAEPVEQSSTEETSNPYLLELDDDAPQTSADGQQTIDPSEALKPYLGASPYINSPETLQAAIADSHLLYDVANGQQPAGNLLEPLRQNNPQVWQNVVNGLAQYIQQQTGYQFVDPKSLPQSQSTDPVQQRIDAIEQQFRDQDRQRSEQVLQQRAGQAQRVLLDHLTSSLKGSFLEGDEPLALSLLGKKLGGKEDKIIDAIERKDFSSIDAALKQVKREEADRYNRYATRIASQRKAKASSLPKLDNPGIAAASRKTSFDLSTREGRIAAMNAM